MSGQHPSLLPPPATTSQAKRLAATGFLAALLAAHAARARRLPATRDQPVPGSGCRCWRAAPPPRLWGGSFHLFQLPEACAALGLATLSGQFLPLLPSVCVCESPCFFKNNSVIGQETLHPVSTSLRPAVTPAQPACCSCSDPCLNPLRPAVTPLLSRLPSGVLDRGVS